jgi:hypothetical protein
MLESGLKPYALKHVMCNVFIKLRVTIGHNCVKVEHEYQHRLGESPSLNDPETYLPAAIAVAALLRNIRPIFYTHHLHLSSDRIPISEFCRLYVLYLSQLSP